MRKSVHLVDYSHVYVRICRYEAAKKFGIAALTSEPRQQQRLFFQTDFQKFFQVH